MRPAGRVSNHSTQEHEAFSTEAELRASQTWQGPLCRKARLVSGRRTSRSNRFAQPRATYQVGSRFDGQQRRRELAKS